MTLRFARSARRHKIGKAHAWHVIENNPYTTEISQRDGYTTVLWWSEWTIGVSSWRSTRATTPKR